MPGTRGLRPPSPHSACDVPFILMWRLFLHSAVQSSAHFEKWLAIDVPEEDKSDRRTVYVF